MRRWIDALSSRGRTCAVALAVAMVPALATGVLDLPSLAITVGGALAVAAGTFSRARMRGTLAVLREAMAVEPDPEELVRTMKRLARIHRLDGTRALERAAAADADPFVRRALALAIDADDLDLLNDQLLAEAGRHLAALEDARQVLVTLGKLFPGFGLIGTLVGLTMLLRNLHGGTLATVGPGLALAVQTTLYGALLANVVTLPLAARVQAHAVRRTRRLQMTIDGVLLVVQRAFPSQVDGILRAHAGTAGEEARGVQLAVAGRAA